MCVFCVTSPLEILSAGLAPERKVKEHCDRCFQSSCCHLCYHRKKGSRVQMGEAARSDWGIADISLILLLC